MSSSPQRAVPLHIGVDAGPLLGEGGISEYVRPLVRSLLSLDAATDYRLILRTGWRPGATPAMPDAPAPLTRVRLPDRLLSLWWDRLGWTLPVHRRLWESLDLFLATCLVVPVLPRGQVVSIVYDLTPLRLPALFPERERFRKRVRALLARSRVAIAISHRTRQDLVELLDADPARIRVIHPGRREGFRPAAPPIREEVLRRLGIPGPYILYVGSLGPHKNVATLLDAFERLRGDGSSAILVLAGHPRWGEATLRRREASPHRDAIRVVGPVAAAELPALYSGAACFVFPSLYEGFGLPVLEAMACGAPVVASDRGALPEVVGDAGIVVNPEDPAALADAIRRLLDDPALRAAQSRAGLERADRFTWDGSARGLRAVFAELAGGGQADA
jgi:glycosyltransferase involved in cell wall biosynthesis